VICEDFWNRDEMGFENGFRLLGGSVEGFCCVVIRHHFEGWETVLDTLILDSLIGTHFENIFLDFFVLESNLDFFVVFEGCMKGFVVVVEIASVVVSRLLERRWVLLEDQYYLIGEWLVSNLLWCGIRQHQWHFFDLAKLVRRSPRLLDGNDLLNLASSCLGVNWKLQLCRNFFLGVLLFLNHEQFRGRTHKE